MDATLVTLGIIFMSTFLSTTGPYAIGTLTKHLTDSSRHETFSQNSDAKRELLIQIWYPAKDNEGKISYPYASDIIIEWMDGLKKGGFAENSIQELKNLKTHALPNANIQKNDAPYPVILFSHGYVALRSAYTSYYEELASQGYIVIGIAHTYYAQIVKFSDGRIIEAVPENITQQKLIKEDQSQKEQTLWLQDAQFVLDSLEKLNEDSSSGNVLYHALDLNKIGYFGHSFGGSTAIQMCRNDDRIKAAIDLDGGLFGANATNPIDKPIMFIIGEEAFNVYNRLSDSEIAHEAGFSEDIISVLREKYFEYIPKLFESLQCAYLVTLKEAKHAAFSDWVLLKDIPLYKDNTHLFDLEKLTGRVDGQLITQAVNKYVTTFFDKYLKKKNIDIMQQPFSSCVTTCKKKHINE